MGCVGLSQTVVVSEETKYLYKLRETTKKYVTNLIEERILIRRAREASKEERKERRELLAKRNALLKSDDFDIETFRSLMSRIGELNREIAKKEKPYRDKAKPYRQARNEAFIEMVKEMVFHGDLRLDKVIEAGLLKLK